MKLLFATLAFSAFGTGVLAGDNSFPIQNNGPADLISFKYSESGANDWTDIFENDRLPGGQSIDIVLRDNNSCVFDIRAEFSDGSTLSQTAINLCENEGGYEF